MALEQVTNLRDPQARGDSGNELDIESALKVNRREISDELMRKFASYAAEMFEAFGLDPESHSHLQSTYFLRVGYAAHGSQDARMAIDSGYSLPIE